MNITVVVALIGAVGTLLAALTGSVLTYKLAHRRISDKEQLLIWRVAFDRPAFRGPYNWHSDTDAFEAAITDTIQCVTTGMLVNRSGQEIVAHRGKGFNYLRNSNRRAQMSRVVDRLVAVRDMSRNPPADPGAMDNTRDTIIKTMNELWHDLHIDPMPLPSAAWNYKSVFAE